MTNPFKNKRIIIPVIILLFVTSIVAFAADPGSNLDPLISLSYFNDKIENLQNDLSTALSEALNVKFNELETKITKTLEDLKKNNVDSLGNFELITLGENESIICEAGTEIIVRSGKSCVITSQTSSGGISDITSGKDLSNNEEIINNHLLIVPKADGRGIKALITGAIMIKGNYTKQIAN